MEAKEYAAYGALLIGAFVLAWVAMDGAGVLSQPAGSPAVGQDGKLLATEPNARYFAQEAQTVGSECGNLNDPQNLQHLSHHPSQFQACYKAVDPAKFKAAVGKDVSEFIAQGGSSEQDSMAGHHG